MPTIRLTDLTVAALKADADQVDYYCDRVHRFGVRVTKHGTKTFFVFVGNPRRRQHLGKYPDTKLKDARDAARRMLVAPSVEPGTIALADVFDAYSAQHLDRNYKWRSAKEAKRLIAKHLAAFMTRPISKISKSDLLAIIGGLPPGEANHLFGVLRTFFNWCERHDHLVRSPLTHLSKPHREKTRDRVLSDDELRRVWLASDCLGTFGKIVRLLILTGQRKGEIAGLTQAYLQQGIITWPAVATKNEREHTLPVPASVFAMATDLAAILATKSCTAWSAPKVKLDALAEVHDWTLHDLRRTAATGMARLGVAPHVVERILNHASGTFAGVAGIYNRFEYFPEMRDALERWVAHVDQIVADDRASSPAAPVATVCG